MVHLQNVFKLGAKTEEPVFICTLIRVQDCRLTCVTHALAPTIQNSSRNSTIVWLVRACARVLQCSKPISHGPLEAAKL